MAGHRCDRRRAWQWNSEPETFDMVTDIRERFLAGFCMCSDTLALERKYGAALVAAWLPPSMQVSLPGRALDDEGWIEGIPARFWPEELR